MDDEIWKDIPNFEGLYKVDKMGNIYSEYTNKVLKPSISRSGYKQYVLHKNKKQHIMTAHRAVAITFIPTENKNLVVNHIDENKLNCNVENLEWITRKDNNNYNGNKAAETTYKTYSKDFYAYSKDGKAIGKYKGIKRYARDNHMSSGCLSSIISYNNNKDFNKMHSYRNIIFTEKEQ